MDGAADETAAASGSGQPAANPTNAGSHTTILPKANPYADIKLADYVRDVVALVLLLISFGMPWDGEGDVTSKVYVILATLLSIVSLSLPYLSRAGVFPPTFGADRLRMARLLANVPYAVIVVIALVLNFIDGFDGVGIGVGAVFGLAGVILAAQPRTSEQVPSDSALWRTITLGLGGAIVACSAVAVLLDLVDSGDVEWHATTRLILVIALFLVVIGLPFYGFDNRDAGWRDAIVVLGGVSIVFGFWQLSDSIGGVWPVSAIGPVMLFWPALAAAVTAVGMNAHVDFPAGAARWVRDVLRLSELTVVVGAFGVALTAVQLAANDFERGAKITMIVLYLIVVAAGLVGRGALSRDAVQGRSVALTVAGVVIVLGIVLAAVAPAVGFVEAGILSMLFVFSAAIVAMLTVPNEVRNELAVMASAPSARPAQSAGTEQQSQADAAPDMPSDQAGNPNGDTTGDATTAAYTAAVAADPATPLEVLADIAAQEPELRPYVAANPSTYPELLQWLGNLGDPAVDEALHGRNT